MTEKENRKFMLSVHTEIVGHSLSKYSYYFQYLLTSSSTFISSRSFDFSFWFDEFFSPADDFFRLQSRRWTFSLRLESMKFGDWLTLSLDCHHIICPLTSLSLPLESRTFFMYLIMMCFSHHHREAWDSPSFFVSMLLPSSDWRPCEMIMMTIT